jgi:hypothetical protein
MTTVVNSTRPARPDQAPSFVQVFTPLLRSGIPSDELHVYLLLCDYAGKKGFCWPSDRTLGGWIGRSQDTASRILSRLEARGLVSRTRVEPSGENPSGRVITVNGRVTPCRKPAAGGAARKTGIPAASLRHDLRLEEKQYRPPAPGTGAAGEQKPDADAEDIAKLREYATGTNPVLARLGRLGLERAGVPAAFELTG